MPPEAGASSSGKSATWRGASSSWPKSSTVLRQEDSCTPLEFAQIENVALNDALVAQPAIFHDTPIEMLFAILATF